MTFTKLHDGRSYGYSWSGPKWRCDDCGKTGYGTLEKPYTWSNSCLNGHSECPWCGRVLTLRNDGTPRVHSRCPERPDEAELLRLYAAEVRHDARLGVLGPLGSKHHDLLDRLTRPLEETP